MFAFSKFLPLIQQFGHYLKQALDHYADLRAAGKEAGPEIIAFYLKGQMADWDPKVNGRSLLDAPTREAAARFLAGVAVNFSGA